MRKGIAKSRGAITLPRDVRISFVERYNRGIDMDLTFAIWQALMANICGTWLTRENFDKAWLLWWKSPRQYPVMTLVVDTEEMLAATIMSLEEGKRAA
jgi:hypothetical protein